MDSATPHVTCYPAMDGSAGAKLRETEDPMSQVNRSVRALAGATIAASFVLSGCRSAIPSEPVEIVIAVSAFETLVDAEPTVAQDMAANLAAALNADSRIKAQTETGVSRPSRD